jgi:hypothetical protein
MMKTKILAPIRSMTSPLSDSQKILVCAGGAGKAARRTARPASGGAVNNSLRIAETAISDPFGRVTGAARSTRPAAAHEFSP